MSTPLRAIDGGGLGTPKLNAKGLLELPPLPAADDHPGQLAWLTHTFALDPKHPITGGERRGAFGPDGRVVLARADAPKIAFEPATRLNTPLRLIESLSWQRLPSDPPLPPYKSQHCAAIVQCLVMACSITDTISDEQEAGGIVGTFMHVASAVEDFTTYGTSGERYEAACALRRPVDDHSGRQFGPPRYLIDSNTGEYVIAVSDLIEAARRHTGSSLPRGWLAGRMDALGWKRITIEGHALPGRDGRSGPHARIFAFRGLLPHDDTDESVTT